MGVGGGGYRGGEGVKECTGLKKKKRRRCFLHKYEGTVIVICSYYFFYARGDFIRIFNFTVTEGFRTGVDSYFLPHALLQC